MTDIGPEMATPVSDEPKTAAPTEQEPTHAASTSHQDAEPEAAQETGAAPAPTRSLVRSLAVLCVVFFLGTVAMSIVAANEHRKAGQVNNARSDAQQVASRMASALVNFDYTDLNKSKDRVLSLATGKFRREYDQAFKGGLEVLLSQTKARSSGVVKNVFLESIEGGNTTAVVALDQAVEGISGTKRQFDAYVELTLVKVAGSWKVDGVSYLNPAQTAEGTPNAPGAQTPTTAPAK